MGSRSRRKQTTHKKATENIRIYLCNNLEKRICTMYNIKRGVLVFNKRQPWQLIWFANRRTRQMHLTRPAARARLVPWLATRLLSSLFSRMLIHKSRYEEAIQIAKKVAESIKVVDPKTSLTNKQGETIGPLANANQFTKVQGLIKKGIDEGARVVTGGVGRPEGFTKGYFVKPTIFADVNNQMTIAREEIFGPVLCMIPYNDENEAIRIANDTECGYNTGFASHLSFFSDISLSLYLPFTFFCRRSGRLRLRQRHRNRRQNRQKNPRRHAPPQRRRDRPLCSLWRIQDLWKRKGVGAGRDHGVFGGQVVA